LFFKKIIFDISASKWSKNTKKMLIWSKEKKFIFFQKRFWNTKINRILKNNNSLLSFKYNPLRTLDYKFSLTLLLFLILNKLNPNHNFSSQNYSKFCFCFFLFFSFQRALILYSVFPFNSYIATLINALWSTPTSIISNVCFVKSKNNVSFIYLLFYFPHFIFILIVKSEF